MRPAAFDAKALRQLASDVGKLKPEEVVVAGLVNVSLQLDYIARLLETSAKVSSPRPSNEDRIGF
jgi:hypothetical protein